MGDGRGTGAAGADDGDGRAPAAEAWTVATFNVVGVALVGLLAGHASGALVDTLPGVGTLAGFAAFGYLWALAVGATRWVVAAGGLRRSREGAFGRLLLRGAAGGALVGAGFVAGVVAAVTAADVLTGTLDAVSSLFVLVVGGLAGGVVGSVVGVVSALVDAALYRLSWLVVPDGG